MNWFTKNKIFFISSIGLALYVFSKFSVDMGICSNYASKCSDNFYLVLIFSLIFLPVFVFSLATFKLKEATFISWRNFSVLAVPISLIIITFLPTDTHGLDFIPATKGTVIFLLTILYSIISLALILYKSFKK